VIEIWKRTELDRLMRAHGFHYSKARGQNFLVDRNVLDKVVEAAELTAADNVVEPGPGAGALTVLLAQAAGRVTAVEIDGRLIPILREVTEGLANVDIVHDDFLKFRPSLQSWAAEAIASAHHCEEPQPSTQSLGAEAIASPCHCEEPQPSTQSLGAEAIASPCHCEEPQPSTMMRRSNPEGTKKPENLTMPYKLVGNLPYYITTPIIAGMFEPGPDGKRPAPPELAVFMVQKEVAERLMSPPGKKTYGAISVLVQYYAEIELLFPVSREVFAPRPNVDSAVIRLRPRDLSGDDAETAARMFRLVRAGFDMRRKTLRNSLASAGFPAEALAAALEQAGVDPSHRAETLGPRDFYALAACLP